MFIMQSKSTFLEFLDVQSSTPSWPPQKIIQGLWPRFHFIGLALTHIATWKQKSLPSCRLREVGSILWSSSYSSMEKPSPSTKTKTQSSCILNWDCMGGPPVLDAKSVLSESVLVNRLFVCMILKCKHN